MARPISQAKKDLEKAKKEEEWLNRAEQKKPGSVTAEQRAENSKAEESALQNLQEATRQLDEAVEQVREVAKVYHPFDRETAKEVKPEQMEQRLGQTLEGLQKQVEDAGLPERTHQAVSRAQGRVVLLVGCLAWFWSIVRQKMEKLELSEKEKQEVMGLMAGYYWEMAAAKEQDPEQRRRLLEMAQRLKEKAWSKESALGGYDEKKRKEVAEVAQDCAELFQRSSSCVEGRNGRLSLFHHGQTRMSGKRLEALTVVHNYVTGEDGTTAAERFFGHKQTDAFAWLLEKLPDPKSPNN